MNLDDSTPKVSFILPCFNVEKYVGRCVQSIHAQSVNWEFEIIAVNDASTDRTLDTLISLQQKYPRLRIVSHLENRKLSGARTTGIQHAQGEYIMHIDADDYLIPHSLDNIFDENQRVWDILMANFIVDQGNGNKKARYNIQQNYFNMEISSDRKIIFDNVAKGACVGKFFRRNLLNDLAYFDYNYNIGEDRAFNIEVFSRAKGVVYDKRPIYFYPYVETSLTHSGFNRSIIDWNNCWAHNICDLYCLKRLSKEAIDASRRELERNSIGHLLRIRKEKNYGTLYTVWQSFLGKQLVFFGKKGKWYNLLLKLPKSTVTEYVFLMSAASRESISDQIHKILRS